MERANALVARVGQDDWWALVDTTMETIVDHMLEVTKQQLPGHDSQELGYRAQMIAECEKRKVPASQRKCLVAAKTLADLAECRAKDKPTPTRPLPTGSAGAPVPGAGQPRRAGDPRPGDREVLAEIAERGMGGLVAVSRGSAEDPQLICLRYDGGASAGGTIGLVGRVLVILGRTHMYEGHGIVKVAHGVRAAVAAGLFLFQIVRAGWVYALTGLGALFVVHPIGLHVYPSLL